MADDQLREIVAGLVSLTGIAVAAAVREYLRHRVRKTAVDDAGKTAPIAEPEAISDRIESLPPPPDVAGTELDPLTRQQLRNLHPSIAERARALLSVARAEGLSLVVTSGYRSSEQQARLYAQGRTAPGKIVTHAKPGTSWHNHGLAFDVAPLNAAGKPHWPNDWKLWQRIGACGESVGLSWGGRWKVPDLPHFEFHPGLTIADAIRGRRPPLPSEHDD